MPARAKIESRAPLEQSRGVEPYEEGLHGAVSCGARGE